MSFIDSIDPSDINAVLGGLSAPQKSRYLRIYAANQNRMDADARELRSELNDLFREAQDELSADVAKVFGSMGTENWDLTSMRRAGRDVALMKQIESRIQALGGRIDTTISSGLVDAFQKSSLMEAYLLDATTPPTESIDFGLLNDNAILALLNEPFNGATFSQRLGLITDDMAHTIKQELTRSMMEGESWNEASMRIRDEMGATTQRGAWARADTITRTELARAQSLGSLQIAADNADVAEDTVWLAHPGACDDCQELNGQPVDEVGYPPEGSHPNCTCDIMIVPKGWDELSGGDMPGFPSFGEWAASKGASNIVEA